jgi:hypothetical protein
LKQKEKVHYYQIIKIKKMALKMGKWMNKLNKRNVTETREINFYFNLGYKL